MSDGKIIIGTEVDESGVDKGIKDIEKKKVEKKEIKVDSNIEELEKKLENLEKKEKELKEKEINSMNEGLKFPEETPERKALEEQMMKAKTDQLELNNEIRKAKGEIINAKKKLELQTKEIEKQNDLLSERQSLEIIPDLNNVEEQGGKVGTIFSKIFDKVKDKASGIVGIIGSGIKIVGTTALTFLKKVIPQIAKVALKIAGIGVIFGGIIGILALVGKAFSKAFEQNEQAKTDIQYIGYALGQMIQPLVDRLSKVISNIVSLVAKLLQYINYLAMAWFKIDLFGNASVENFKKSTAGASKLNKELNKTLAGFDEMNVLSDNSSSDTSSGAGTIAPSFDLSNMEDVPIPSWLQWLGDNGEKVIAIIAGIAAALVLLKLGLGGIMSLGIGLAITGIILLIQDVIDFIEDPSWENFSDILVDLSLILAGLALAFIAVNATNPVGWIMLAIAAITALVAVIIKNWDKIKEALGKALDWIKQKFKPLIDFFKSIFGPIFENTKITIDNIKQVFQKLWDKIKEIFGPVATWFKDKFSQAKEKITAVFSPIVEWFGKLWDKIKGKLKDWGTKIGETVGGAFKNVINKVLETVEKILNKPINTINSLITKVNKLGFNLTKLQTFSLPRLAKGGIVNMPSRGVNIGGAIAGESGAEGVIPLTDSQQMDLLGESIARHMVINLTNITDLNGRQIAKEIKKINNENDFAYNR